MNSRRIFIDPPAMTPVPVHEYRSPPARWARRCDRAVASTTKRSRWWYPLTLLLILISGVYSILVIDQRWSATLIWPEKGARFVEIGSSATDLTYRSRMVVVAGGLNRPTGNLVAAALAPSLGDSDTRLFSLGYGTGIVDADVNAKFDALVAAYQPATVVLVGNSMGGDLVLGIAAHLADQIGTAADPDSETTQPALEAIYLDCTPLGTADVRLADRARANLLLGLTERTGTDGGAGIRLFVEMIVTHNQWATGTFPFWQIKPGDLAYKWSEVWREKLNPLGVSTQLVKDQYGVIRRFSPDDVFQTIPATTRLIYFRPEEPTRDRTINVARVEAGLHELAARFNLDLTIVPVPGGTHASAVRDAPTYNALITELRRTR